VGGFRQLVVKLGDQAAMIETVTEPGSACGETDVVTSRPR
jgi:hypothetical protein